MGFSSSCVKGGDGTCPYISELLHRGRDNTGMIPALCQEHRRCSTSADTLNSSENMQPSFPFLQAFAIKNHLLGHRFSRCFGASRALPGPRATDSTTGEARRLSPSTRLPRVGAQREAEGIPTSWRGRSPPCSPLRHCPKSRKSQPAIPKALTCQG